MEIIRISAIGIITAFCVAILKENKSETAMLLGIAGGCIILFMLVDYITQIFSVIKDMTEKIGIDGSILKIVMKIMGIGFIAEFSADIIEESGSKALASKVITAGKIIIFTISLPIIAALFNLIAELMT